LETEVKESQDRVAEAEVVVTKKGQTTIPVKLRRKYKIEEGTRLAVIDTKEGILYKPKKSIWDMIGSGSAFATVEEMNKLLDKLRHENE
jgi:AbrB family looped-hinge helix DNA binding protein